MPRRRGPTARIAVPAVDERLVAEVAKTIKAVVTLGTVDEWSGDAARSILAQHHDLICARMLRYAAKWMQRDPEMAPAVEALQHLAATLELRSRPRRAANRYPMPRYPTTRPPTET